MIVVAAYLIGSVPFGILLARIFGLADPRTIGSGNIGATNMLRTGRKDIAALTLLLDMGKGVAAVWLARQIDPAPAAMALAALMAAVGHMASPWLKFSGGKGVATLLGAAFAFQWVVGALFCLMFLLMFHVKHWVSLASIAALASLPLLVLWRSDAMSAVIFAVASTIAIYKHRGNIHRLLRGEEPKTYFRGKHV